MRYIDLNMVRAGVVTDPADWEWSGYREIQSGRLRYRRIDLETTARLLGLDAAAEVGPWQRRSVWESLERRTDLERRCEWTESIAVGGESYLQAVQNALSFAVRDRQVTPFGEDAFALRESAGPYRPDNTGEIPPLSLPNALRWRLSR
jgi:putative transposase